MRRDDGFDSEPPIPPRLFQSPLHRDPLFLWTAGVALFTGLVIGFGNSPNRNFPPVVDGVLAAAFFGFSLGVLPAWVRLLLQKRRHRARRQAQDAEGAQEPWERPVSSFDAEISSLLLDPVTTRPDGPDVAPSPGAPHDRSERTGPPPPARIPPRPAPRIAGLVNTESVNLVKPVPREADYTFSLQHAKQIAPYPIAYAARAVDSTASALHEHQAILDAAEVVAVSVCSYLLGVAVSTETRLGSNHPATRLLRNSIPGLGASFDSWLSAARGLAEQLPVATPGRKDPESTFLASLDPIKEERNRSAHGSRPRTEEDARMRLQGGLREAFARTLQAVAFLERSQWVVVESITLNRDGRWTATAMSAMGDHPDFVRVRISPDGPMIDGELYALGPDDRWVALGPIITHRYCVECSRHQMFYADQVTKDQRVRYRQFMHPHAAHDVDLVSDMQRLRDTLWTQGGVAT